MKLSQTATSATSVLRSRSRPITASIVLVGGIVALIFGLGLSISVGAANIELSTVWAAVFFYKPNLTTHQIIWELRLPRAVAGAIVGACFAVAGALMQGMTRNPLADSGLLGLNAGSVFAIALCFAFFPDLPYIYLILFSFLGAGLGSGLVFGIGAFARNGMTPIRLALSGAAVSALLVALSEGIANYYQVAQDMAFYYAGGLAGTKWFQLQWMFPWVAAALIGAMVLSRPITMLSLGEEVARGLGQRTARIKLLATIVVLILAGTAVSAIGSVGFVGLLIPHVVRYLVGVDYRWIIPCSAVMGGLLVVLADLGARMVNPPYETPLNALIALIGIPFFLFLARKGRRELE
ncbi:FecCD family ABC transporter permease [Paenibacillus aurantiacus]|uniref:FecCD family ABC transporter permease n=1 Tax=Paenibacillus aurantiacus TaxID=1936118 RepID=A0ABV5KRT0_9BACL